MGPVPLEATADTTFGATFSFNVPPFDTRRVYIDTACFNANGNLSTSTVIAQPPPGGYPAWQDNYSVAPWIQVKTAMKFPTVFQAGQIQVSNNSTFATGTFVYSESDFMGGLTVYTYTSDQTFPDTPAASVVATSTSFKPSYSYGMVPTLGGVQLFWNPGTPSNLYHVKITGTSPTPTAAPLFTGLEVEYGVSACRIGTYADGILGERSFRTTIPDRPRRRRFSSSAARTISRS